MPQALGNEVKKQLIILVFKELDAMKLLQRWIPLKELRLGDFHLLDQFRDAQWQQSSPAPVGGVQLRVQHDQHDLVGLLQSYRPRSNPWRALDVGNSWVYFDRVTRGAVVDPGLGARHPKQLLEVTARGDITRLEKELNELAAEPDIASGGIEAAALKSVKKQFHDLLAALFSRATCARPLRHWGQPRHRLRCHT